jgi:hypothetical protein
MLGRSCMDELEKITNASFLRVCLRAVKSAGHNELRDYFLSLGRRGRESLSGLSCTFNATWRLSWQISGPEHCVLVGTVTLYHQDRLLSRERITLWMDLSISLVWDNLISLEYWPSSA